MQHARDTCLVWMSLQPQPAGSSCEPSRIARPTPAASDSDVPAGSSPYRYASAHQSGRHQGPSSEVAVHAVGAWDVHGVSGCRPALQSRPPPVRSRPAARAPASAAGTGACAARRRCGERGRPSSQARPCGPQRRRGAGTVAGAVGAGSGLGESTSGRCSTRPRSPPRTAIRPSGRSAGASLLAVPPRPRSAARAATAPGPSGLPHDQTGPRRRPHRLRVKGIERDACHGAWPERSTAPSNGASPAAAPASRERYRERRLPRRLARAVYGTIKRGLAGGRTGFA